MTEHKSASSNLIFMRKSEVPKYLQHGEFYQSLNDDDDEQISVPANTLKPNTMVENDKDLDYMLTSLRFWSVDNVIKEIVIYCLDKNPTSCIAVLESFKADFRYVDIILQMLYLKKQERAKFAINSGMLDLVAILHESSCALPDGCHIAARAGHLPILQFLHENGGRLDTLSEIVIVGEGKFISYACACSHAAAGGNLACLDYVHKCGCPWGYDAIYPAIWEGQTACVEYAIQHGCPLFDVRYCCVAARKGHLDILKLLHTAGAPWYESTCSEASEHGHLDCLQFAHENGCPWNGDTCLLAVKHGQPECLKYAHQHGCEWDDHISYYAAKNGHLECLKYAHEHSGYDEVGEVCTVAAEEGHLECLEFAHEHNYPWGEETCCSAAKSGHLECLKYMYEHGCPWDSDTCLIAASKGHLECLKYAHEHGCFWNENTLNIAARNGHLSCLQYAHEQGCPVGVNLYEVAKHANQRECAEYINNCIC